MNVVQSYSSTSPVEGNSTRQLKEPFLFQTATDKYVVLQHSAADRARDLDYGKVLILVGATGSGKSTLMNGFVNYIFGVQYRDDFRYQLISDEEESQRHLTKSITAYTFPQNETSSKLPFTLTIVDTPAYGDTDEIERDKEITKQIKKFAALKVENGIDQIDGIGFVVPASLPRLTSTQKYIFDSIFNIFGNDISKNSFLMVPSADGKTLQVLDAIKEQGIEFNNSCLLPDDENAANNDDDTDFNERFWNLGEKSFNHFLSVLGRSKPIRMRDRMKCEVENFLAQVRLGLFAIEELHHEERIVHLHGVDIEKNRNFDYTVETRQSKVKIPMNGRHVTNCLKCNVTCHQNCSISIEEAKVRSYWSMDGFGYCTICPKKCFWNVHRNSPYIFELYTVELMKTSQELKKRYEIREGKTQKEAIVFGLRQDLEMLFNCVLYYIRKIKKYLELMEDVVSRTNRLSELEYIDLLIRSEKLEAKEGFMQRVETLQEVRRQAEQLSKITDEQETQIMAKKLKEARKHWENSKTNLSNV